jgi:hypothetical protein
MVSLGVIEVGKRVQPSSLELVQTDLAVPILVNDLKHSCDNVVCLFLVFLVVLEYPNYEH